MDLIVNFTPNGMIPTKRLTPHVPISVAEIVEDVHRAVELGITMVHLHARDESTGEPTYHRDTYGRIIAGIRAFAQDLIICVSTSGRTFKEFKQRADVLQLDGDLKPDMGSLTLSSLNSNEIASLNAPDMIQGLAGEMQARGILAELEAFDESCFGFSPDTAGTAAAIPRQVRADEAGGRGKPDRNYAARAHHTRATKHRWEQGNGESEPPAVDSGDQTAR